MNITVPEVCRAILAGLTSEDIKNDLFSRLQKGEDPVTLLVDKIQNLYMKGVELQSHVDDVERGLQSAMQEIAKLNNFLSPKERRDNGETN